MLDSGFRARIIKQGGKEYLYIDLRDLYHGFGRPEDSFEKWANLFKELHEKGYRNNGIEIEWGFYDEVNGLELTMWREIPKS